ncbi:MAG: FAD-dependent oxidoreductase [Candidatus Nanoarchaeia archaeon]
MQTVKYQFSGEIPLTIEADVIVVGGGPGGIGAAVMSARQGAKTVLIERYGVLGGMASVGEVQPFMPNHYGSFTKGGQSMDRPVYLDWVKKMKDYYPDSYEFKKMKNEFADWDDLRIHKDVAALAAEDLCLNAGVKIIYHHFLADVIKKDRNIDFIVLLSKSGFTAAKAKNYIDCTGDADLAAKAGCEFELGGPSGYCQPMTTCFKLSNVDGKRIPPGKEITKLYNEARAAGEINCPREDVLYFACVGNDIVHFNSTRILKKSGINGLELSEAEIEGHRQVRELINFLRKRVAGFENAYLYSMASHIGVRETRRIKGIKYLTVEAFEKRQKFPDAIARVNYPIDIHNPNGTGTKMEHIPNTDWYEIPYGCIVPKDADNLLVGGRPISVDHAIHSSMRVMPPACSVGQAAGMAAALSSKTGKKVCDLDGCEIRKHLVEAGAFL